MSKIKSLLKSLLKVIKVTVDGVILREKEVLLIKRGKEPFKGYWALPGGSVEYGETTERAVVREVKEETGLNCDIVRLIGVYSNPDRDPKVHSISAAYLMELSRDEKLRPGDDAVRAQWFAIDDLPHKTAFDHKDIIQDALRA